MSDRDSRRLPVIGGRVQCTPDKAVTVDRCGFCVHSAHVVVGGREHPSPARAYCSRCRVTPGIDMKAAEVVICDDVQGEGFRSIMSVIS